MNNAIRRNVLGVLCVRGRGQFSISRTSQVSSPNVRGKNQARFLGQRFGTGTRRDPTADWYTFGPFSGQEIGTPEALISGPSNFVPKLTLCETSRLRCNACNFALAGIPISRYDIV